MNQPVRPSTIAPPAANYEHAVLSDGPRRLLHTSGVVPIDAGGGTPAGLADQAALVWRNIGEILASAGMTTDDIVSVVTYAVAGNDLGPVMAARDAALGSHRAASTLVTVPALARPEWLVEVAVVAAD